MVERLPHDLTIAKLFPMDDGSEESRGKGPLGRSHTRRTFLVGAAKLASLAGATLMGAKGGSETPPSAESTEVSNPTEIPLSPQSSAEKSEQTEINPAFETFYNMIAQNINTDVNPEYWKEFKDNLSYKDPQAVYRHVIVNAVGDSDGNLRELKYSYSRAGFEGKPGVPQAIDFAVNLSRSASTVDSRILLSLSKLGLESKSGDGLAEEAEKFIKEGNLADQEKWDVKEGIRSRVARTKDGQYTSHVIDATKKVMHINQSFGVNSPDAPKFTAPPEYKQLI